MQDEFISTAIGDRDIGRVAALNQVEAAFNGVGSLERTAIFELVPSFIQVDEEFIAGSQ